ncbi:chromate efflux transporter [Martelella radicis]|uniref:Chromate transporter n=1 Tax=Martelella radicis TaxID=1397476 RepID=A0A7W6KMH1_9HYPH|nr:chromate transporter [Martelella radicis]
MTESVDQDNNPSFRELIAVFARIGCLSFGGPAGQIALMHRIVVEEKGWLKEDRYLHALNYCMLLPGPEAQQLATYIGWLLFGVRGGVAAGLLFVLPGLLVIIAFAASYAALADTSWLEAVFMGLKAAVLAIVVQALWRMANKSLKGPVSVAFAVIAFVALFVFGIAFPIVVFAAGVGGYFLLRGGPDDWDEGGISASPTSKKGMRAIGTIIVWTIIWLLPLGILAALGGDGTLADIFGFFVKVALFSFGGAYAVLSYVAQEAVTTYHWVTPAEMLDGLALAETTPGPLVLVLCFVGFLGAYAVPAFSAPLISGVIGALLTAWAIFVPSFVFIFAGAPFIEELRKNPALTGAMAGIGAAIVGVIANLSLWFALHVMFDTVGRIELFVLPPFIDAGPVWPDWSSLHGWSLLLSLLSAVALFALRIGVVPLLLGAGLAGLAIATWL